MTDLKLIRHLSKLNALSFVSIVNLQLIFLVYLDKINSYSYALIQSRIYVLLVNV